MQIRWKMSLFSVSKKPAGVGERTVPVSIASEDYGNVRSVVPKSYPEPRTVTNTAQA